METNYIEFRKTRHFSDKFSATFDFLRQSFVPLGKALLYICGPLALLTALGYTMYMEEFFAMFRESSLNNSNPENVFSNFASFFGLAGFLTIVSLLAYLVLTLTVLEYINLYIEKKTADISVNEVWDRVRSSFWNALGSAILLLILYLIVSAIAGGIIFMLAESIGLIFLFVFVLVFVLFYFIVVLTLFFNILINEKRSVGEFGSILSRCFTLIRGKWWSTFGLLLIASLVVGLAGGILSAPIGFSQMASLFENMANPQALNDSMLEQSVGVSIYSGFVMFVRTLLQAFVLIALSFQYFNLVERNEATGLVSQITDIDDSQGSQYGSANTGDSESDERY